MVVGSKNETEQMLLGEIVAQHLEHRLGRTVERRTGLGNTAILYQAILSGEVGIYPEYTGLIESEILKEPADSDPQIVLARVRGQMDLMRRSRFWIRWDLTTPPPWSCAPAARRKVASLSDAARASTDRAGSWASPTSFNPAPTDCRRWLPTACPMAAPRILDPKQLFAALEKGDVDMIATRATDGHLMSPDWKILADDQKVFPSYEACLLVRKDLIAAEPGLRPALAELSGKIQRRHHAEAERGSGRGASARWPRWPPIS